MKYFGNIGFMQTVETSPGIWEEKIVDMPYYGEVTRNSLGWKSGEFLNDNLTISNQISILMDSYIIDNCSVIKYAEFMGVKWKVTNIEVQRPRLILTLGGEYNE